MKFFQLLSIDLSKPIKVEDKKQYLQITKRLNNLGYKWGYHNILISYPMWLVCDKNEMVVTEHQDKPLSTIEYILLSK